VSVRAGPVAPASTPPPAAGVVGDDTTVDTFRDRRRTRLSEGRRRRELLATADPSADPQFINAIAAADRFWGPDEKWRDALQSQRFGSTASAEPTIGSVDAAEVAVVEPVPVTIVRRVRSLGGVLARVRHPRAYRQPTADRIVDEEFNIPVGAADEFLRHLRFGRDAAEATTRTYAGGIALFLQWCTLTGRDWRTAAGYLGMFVSANRHRILDLRVRRRRGPKASPM
jgi:hypothetical protein